MTTKRILCLLLIFTASTCWGADLSISYKEQMAIHTYGGAELLQKVFNAIAMLIYGNGGSGIDKTFHALLRISLAFGGLCSMGLTFFREKFEPLIKNFFLPATLILSCLLVPRTTVYIQDQLAQKSSSAQAVAFTKVDNVPFFLGAFATIVSTVSDTLTTAMEGVTHGVNERLYDWTGHLYAGDHLFQAKKCRIASPVLEDNFRAFCRECVYRDLGIGIYSKEDMIHENNILQFLEDNTSNIRTVYYREISVENNKNSLLGSFIPCREAMKKMNALFNGSSGNTKDIVLGEIGSDFQYLLGESKTGSQDLKNLIKQRIAIQTLKEEIPGTSHSFEAKRAEIFQKENQKILGALGASSIIAMRNFFEATIYMVFPLILLLSLASFGLRPIIQWTQFVLWVNTWPPFYVVVKFLLSSIWSFRAKHAFGDHFELTIFTSEGLSDLYSSMESIAAISMACIPYLSWILLKGGVSQMVHMASSMMSPAQSAAGSAASEKVYGNYSLGNVNTDNVSGYNAQFMQQVLSGRLDHGNTAFNHGATNFNLLPNGHAIIDERTHNLLTGAHSQKITSAAQQTSLSQSCGHVEALSTEYTQSKDATVRQAVGLMHALSKNNNAGESSSLTTSTGVSEAIQNIQAQTKAWSEMTGHTHQKSLDESLALGLDRGFGNGGSDNSKANSIADSVFNSLTTILSAKVGGGVSYKGGTSHLDSTQISDGQNITDSVAINLQTGSNATTHLQSGSSQAEDIKLHKDLVKSFQATEAASQRYQAAYSRQQTLTDQNTHGKTSQLTMNEDLRNELVQEALKRVGNDLTKADEILRNQNSREHQEIIAIVSNQLQPSNPINTTQADIRKNYNENALQVASVSEKDALEHEKNLCDQGQEHIGFGFGETRKQFENLKQKVQHIQSQDEMGLAKKKEAVTDKIGDGISNTHTDVNTGIFKHYYNKAALTAPIRGVVNHVKGFFGKKPPEPPSHRDASHHQRN